MSLTLLVLLLLMLLLLQWSTACKTFVLSALLPAVGYPTVILEMLLLLLLLLICYLDLVSVRPRLGWVWACLVVLVLPTNLS